VDIDADLRAALAQEQLDVAQLAPSVHDTVRKLWEDDSCRQFLRGEWSNVIKKKIDWATLLLEYDTAEKKKEDGRTAVRVILESKGLTFGAASAVSRYMYHQIQLSRGTPPLSSLRSASTIAPCSPSLRCNCTVTPFMRALGEFPRHIYHGAELSPGLAPWMPAVCRHSSFPPERSLVSHGWEISIVGAGERSAERPCGVHAVLERAVWQGTSGPAERC
jgi:hypothetical protein